MTRLAIVEPRTLLGEAVREALADGSGSWTQVDLLTVDPEGAGAVTEVAGQAALVQSLDREVLGRADIALFCGRHVDPTILESLSPTARAILVTPPEVPIDAVPIVAGVNIAETSGAHLIQSPSPGVIMLTHLLRPLAELGRVQIVAHVLEPASARDKSGLDELFDQTRAILSMSDERPTAVFGTQLAFNLLPWQGVARDQGRDLSAILGDNVESQIHSSQAGVFHCCSIGFYLVVESDPGRDAVQELLQQDPLVELAPDPLQLGPVAAAASDRIQLGELVPSPSRGYWVWAVMDNLIGSASNALAIAQY